MRVPALANVTGITLFNVQSLKFLIEINANAHVLRMKIAQADRFGMRTFALASVAAIFNAKKILLSTKKHVTVNVHWSHLITSSADEVISGIKKNAAVNGDVILSGNVPQEKDGIVLNVLVWTVEFPVAVLQDVIGTLTNVNANE